jgi:hypothetical protein
MEVIRDLMDRLVGECIDCGTAALVGNVPIRADKPAECVECGGEVINLPAWLLNLRETFTTFGNARR